MSQDNEPPDRSVAELEAQLAQYKRLLDPALDAMTLDSIRRLVQEIEDRLRDQS